MASHAVRPKSVFRNQNSSDVMKVIAEIYFAPDATYADVTWGKGVFFRKLPAAKVIGLDLKPRYGAQVQADAAHIPLRDKSVDVVVFDPPHQHGRSSTTTLKQQDDYGRMASQNEIHKLCLAAALEIERVARVGAVIKLTDMVEAGRFMPTHLLFAAAVADLFGWPADIGILDSGVVRPVRHARILHWQEVQSYFLVYRWHERAPRSILVG